MSWLYKNIIRRALFKQPPEAIHNFTLRSLGWISGHPLLCRGMAAFLGAPKLPVKLWGLEFPNPVGLAAGMDKEGVALPAWEAMGFGFDELGAVTWHPQPGNPPPRVFRAVPTEAIVNRMGFNNIGAQDLAQRLAWWREQKLWPQHPIGINLGKSKITPLSEAAHDYGNSLSVLWPHADFFVVNVSSPNTPNLRQLQDKAALDQILTVLQSINQRCAQEASGPHPSGHPMTPEPASFHPKPILVKVAPDLTFEALDDILDLIGPRQIAGIVATNTTISRPATSDPKVQRVYGETGGLSGRPLRELSTEVIRHLYHQTRGTTPIIGVGGIFSAADAWEKITMGASLIQIYTSLVYEGPTVVKGIVTSLKQRLEREGMRTLAEAVGIANH